MQESNILPNVRLQITYEHFILISALMIPSLTLSDIKQLRLNELGLVGLFY